MVADYEVEVQDVGSDAPSGAASPMLLDDILEVGPHHPHYPHHPGRPAQPSAADRWASRMPRWWPRLSRWWSRASRWWSRVSRWWSRASRIPTFALLVVVVVGLGIAIALSGGREKFVPPPASQPVALPSAPPLQSSLTSMVAMANSSKTLHDYIVSDGITPKCPPGQPSKPDPVDTVVAVVHRYFPDYALLDASRGVDLTGVCSVTIREVSPTGSILLISISAPPNSGVVPAVVVQGNDVTTTVDVIVLNTGWRIEIGATGATGDQPNSNDVANLAVDSRLVW